MELQWPLILFTSLICWSAGLFGTQGLLAARGKAASSQMPALISSFVIMVIGGIAVFFHLEHWERIFNGFGHITSGITQELIGVIVMFIMMVVVFAMLRRNGRVPRACGVVALIIAIALVVVMGHSYMMASRPVWDSFVQLLSLIGAACILGPASMAFIMALRGDDIVDIRLIVLVGAIISVLTSCVYLIVMAISSGQFSSLGYYYDPTQITSGMLEIGAATSLTEGIKPILVGTVVLCVLIPLILALVGMKKNARFWKIASIIIVLLALIGAIALRVLFYEMGLSILPYY